MAEEEYELTKADKKYILDNVSTTDLVTMTRYITGDEKADGRNKIGKKIRIFASESGLEIETSRYRKKDPYILEVEAQQFIESNIGKMEWMEMAKHIFQDKGIASRDMRAQAVYNYIKEVAPTYIRSNDEIVDEETYEAPKSLYHLVNVVNRYVQNPNDELKMYYENIRCHDDIKKLPSQEIKNLRALHGFMKIRRFSIQASGYKKKHLRDLFESTFVGHTYDKPDLLREEVEQYISLAAETVTCVSIEAQIQMLEIQIDETLNDNSIDAKRLSMTYVELLDKSRRNLDSAKKQVADLQDSLVGSRATRHKNRLAATSNLHEFIKMWKEKAGRELMLQAARDRQALLSEEVERLSALDTIKAHIFGLDPKSIIK
ncbi:MAG: hypothetical protein SGJ02_09440 [bacterium]|nr:hypothetical protein [bacterium]